MSTENRISSDEVDTRPPSQEEDRWFEYIEELPFKSDEFLTIFAEKMLGLNTAMIAAFIAGLKLTEISLSFYIFVPLILFFLSLFCSLYSIYPKVTKGEVRDLNIIREGFLKGIYRRRKIITIAFFSYFFGIVAGAIVMIIG